MFPHGLYKVENLVALISAFAIFFAGYEIAKDVLFEEARPMKNLPIAVGVIWAYCFDLHISISQWEKKKGIELISPRFFWAGIGRNHIKTWIFYYRQLG